MISTKLGKPVLMMDVKVSKDELIKRTSSMLDEKESKAMHKDEQGD